jgi:hypothetical protein
MEIATFLPLAAGQVYLLSYWMTAGIWAFPSGFTIWYPLRISQRLSNSLSAFPSGFPYTLLEVPRGYTTAFKSISQQLSAKTWQYSSLFSERPHFF